MGASDGAGRALSLAAGTLLPFGTDTHVEAAIAAGYDAVGLRVEGQPATVAAVRRWRARLADAGLRVLDVEVVRIGVTAPDAVARVVELGAEAGASWLVTTSEDDDASRTVDGLAALAAACRATATALRPALECMRFTAVRTLAEAVALARRAGVDVGVLVDPLHLFRCGDAPDDVRAARAEPGAPPFPYVQLCDTAVPVLADAELAREARHDRLPPGEGILPLDALLTALPEVPVSVEVQSEALGAALGPFGLAMRCREAATAVLGRPAGP